MDIVERIHHQVEIWLEDEPERQWWNYQKDHKEAATEITRLREENKRMREAMLHIEACATEPVSVTASLEAARVTAMVAIQKMEE